jgi:hypothetical protein
LRLHQRLVMKRAIYVSIFSAVLLGAPAVYAQISFGFQIGPPPAPRAYSVPSQPGPDYEWVEGYWYPEGSHYRWHDGYWTKPPYRGAYWEQPYYSGGHYYAGHWDGDRGRVAHDHRWDHTATRDGDRRDRE